MTRAVQPRPDSAAVVPMDGARDQRRAQALIKALGLDRVPEEQRELALAIAKRYELDPMLRHVVLIDGKPYITRDALLWVAHRSGQLDGIEVTEPVQADVPGLGTFWRVDCTVYRKDMSRPFRYPGRYPVKGKNVQHGPEMAVKCAEVMALRRAFNVSAPTVEERWEQDQAIASAVAAPQPSLADQVAGRLAAVTTSGTSSSPLPGPEGDIPSSPSGSGAPDAAALGPSSTPGEVEAAGPAAPSPGAPDAAAAGAPGTAPAARCEGFDEAKGRCVREPDHEANHRNKGGETWA